MESSRASSSGTVPGASPLLLGWFTWYARRYLRRHFHSLRISRSGSAPGYRDQPLVIYSNHASWWDPLVCLVLKAHRFPERRAFTPIDAAALERYGILRRVGFFPVEQRSARGAVQFLRTSTAILQSPKNLLAITPQSRFADVRERPVHFEGGLGLLATRVDDAVFVPFAAEYVFWEERLPEILVRFGEAVVVKNKAAADKSAAEWTKLFETKMQENQDALAAEVQRRNPEDFQMVLRGGAGQGGVYDWWRSVVARVRGKSFQREHGQR
ncbi:MAG: lysophospholipid acyltransferase family protein [Verrucomicrobiota bacterium]